MSNVPALVLALQTELGNSKHVKFGHDFQGGHHEISGFCAPASLKDTKKLIRRALVRAGYRAQRGSFGVRGFTSQRTPEFHVIKGSYENGTLAVIELEGTASKPILSVMFGG